MRRLLVERAETHAHAVQFDLSNLASVGFIKGKEAGGKKHAFAVKDGRCVPQLALRPGALLQRCCVVVGAVR